MILSLLLIVLGAVENSIRFEFKGLVGLLLKDDSTVDYSLWSIGLALPEASGNPSDPWITFIQVLFSYT
jgi:hypothetical protein